MTKAVQERRMIAVAVSTSIVLHALGLLAVAILLTVGWLAAQSQLQSALVEPPEEKAEITLPVSVEMIEAVPAPPPIQRANRTYVRTEGQPDEATERVEKAARFISDRQTTVGQKGPVDPEGNPDLASQDGVDIPAVEFIRQTYVEGALKPESAAESPPPVAPPVDPTQAAQMAKPVADEGASAVIDPAVAAPPIAPPPTPAVADHAKAVPPDTPRFQRPSEPTRLRGSLSNRGDASVQADDTPEGRYMKLVTESVSKEWHQRRRLHADKITYGTMRVEFFVNTKGDVEDLRIADTGTASALMQNFTLDAVLQAQMPKMPAALVKTLPAGRVPITYEIIVY
jgi:hypothetical protein